MRKLIILYGSETGTAQDVAESLGRDAKRRYFDCVVYTMDDYAINELINEKLAIFVCSTTGQGDTPSNIKSFWKMIMRRNLPTTSLVSLGFAVFGLGDSSYQKYNVVAKKLYKRLSQLGASPIIPLALGDDQHELGADAMLDPCIQTMWAEILHQYPLPPHLTVVPASQILPSKFRVEMLPDADPSPVDQCPANGNIDALHDKQHLVTVISNKRVTSTDHFQDVRLISFDISNSGIRYCPGDVMVLRPENGVDSVNEFIEFMNLDPRDKFLLHPREHGVRVPQALPQTCTTQEAVTKLLDINSIPRRYFFEILASFAEDPIEKEKLIELSSPEGQDERYSYCNRVRRTTLETLQDFPSASRCVPFHYLFDLIPEIQPRSFSIASSPLKHKSTIQLIVAVVKYRTMIHKPRLGLCSNWLAGLDPSTNRIQLPVLIKPGTIEFELAQHFPVICIGPGTGVAPLRSFIHNRAVRDHPENTLFFGCRSAQKDFYFHDEWDCLSGEGKVDYYSACSRDQDNKVYVQHKIREQREKLWALINDGNAYIFVAGNATRMPKDVRDAVKDVIRHGSGVNDEEAEMYVVRLERCGRYQVEAWS